MTRNRLRRKIIFGLFTGILTVFVCELCVSTWVTQTRGPLLYETDPELGYRLRPQLDVTRNANGHRWRMRTDSNGRRIVPAPSLPEEGMTVLLLGDSFAFGEGVDDDQTMAAHIAKKGFRVVNLSVPGYGTHQELMVLRRYLKHESADYVITLVYRNDLNDVLCSYKHFRHRPTAAMVNGRVHVSDFQPPLTDYLVDHSYLFALYRSLSMQNSRTNGDGCLIVADCLRQIQEEALSADCVPLFMCYDAKHPQRIQELLKYRDEFAMTDLTPIICGAAGDVIGPDGVHWNAIGHEIAGAAVLNSLLACTNPDNAQ